MLSIEYIEVGCFDFRRLNGVYPASYRRGTSSENATYSNIGTLCQLYIHTHTYGEWEVTETATCMATGTQTRTCSCGATDTEEIAIDTVDGHEYTDDTCSLCGEA